MVKNSHLAKFKIIQGLLALVHPSAFDLKMMRMTDSERRGNYEEVTTTDEDDRDGGEERK